MCVVRGLCLTLVGTTSLWRRYGTGVIGLCEGGSIVIFTCIRVQEICLYRVALFIMYYARALICVNRFRCRYCSWWWCAVIVGYGSLQSWYELGGCSLVAKDLRRGDPLGSGCASCPYSFFCGFPRNFSLFLLSLGVTLPIYGVRYYLPICRVNYN